jgi:hypothetical protein
MSGCASSSSSKLSRGSSFSSSIRSPEGVEEQEHMDAVEWLSTRELKFRSEKKEGW